MTTNMQQSYLFSRHRPQNTLFNPWKNENRIFVGQVTEVRWEPHEKRHTADVVIMNANNQKWANCPICTTGAGYDRGHLWMPHPEDLVVCAFAEGLHLTPVIIASIYLDKWRLPYPPYAWKRDDYRGEDGTYTHMARDTTYQSDDGPRRLGEHWRHMPRGAFWNVNRLGTMRISDRMEQDPINRNMGATIRDNIDRHFSAGSEFLELSPKKRHTRLFGRKSVIITATQSGPLRHFGSGHIVNTDRTKEPDLEVRYRVGGAGIDAGDYRPHHRQGRVRTLDWKELDEGAGYIFGEAGDWTLGMYGSSSVIGTPSNQSNDTTNDCEGKNAEIKDEYNKSTSGSLNGTITPLKFQPDPSNGTKPREPSPLEDQGTGSDQEHDGCLWLRAVKDVHVHYTRYFRRETWVPEIVDPPCDPYVPKKILTLGMAVGSGQVEKHGEHLSGLNKNGGYLLDTGKAILRTRTEDRQTHYSKKSYRIQSDDVLVLDGRKKTIICNPVLGCSNAAVPRIEQVDPSKGL